MSIKATLNSILIIYLTGLMGSAYAGSDSNRNEASNNLTTSAYHLSAQKYVAWQALKKISGELSVSSYPELTLLADSDFTNDKDSIIQWAKWINSSKARLANDIEVDVSQFDEFIQYFYKNANYYYSDQTNPYYSYFANSSVTNNYGILAIDRIRVVCVGDYCNNPNTFDLKLDIWNEARTSGAIYSDVFIVEVVDNNNTPYPDSNGTEWVYLGFNGVEQVNPNCEKCSLN